LAKSNSVTILYLVNYSLLRQAGPCATLVTVQTVKIGQRLFQRFVFAALLLFNFLPGEIAGLFVLFWCSRILEQHFETQGNELVGMGARIEILWPKPIAVFVKHFGKENVDFFMGSVGFRERLVHAAAHCGPLLLYQWHCASLCSCDRCTCSATRPTLDVA